MSRGAARKKRTRSRRNDPPTAAGPRLWKTILFAALALPISVVLFVQLTRPAGFLAALLQRDAARLSAGDTDGIAVTEGWSDAVRAYHKSFEKLPNAREHLAIQESLKLIVAVEHGHRQPQDAARQAGELVAAFGDNLVIRLVHAVLVDAATVARSPKADPVARFGTMRANIERTPPAGRSTLHNVAFTRAWFDVLKRFTQRPDVAATWATRMDHYQVDAHFAALAVIEKHLSALADALNEKSFRDAAAECRSWLPRVCEGLMASERDSGTRLLCADYLSRATTGRMAGHFHSLRDDYRQSMAAAPIDLTDPTKSPTIAPEEYRRAFRTLVLSALLGTVAVAAAIGFVVAAGASLIAGMSRALRGADDGPAPSRAGAFTSAIAVVAMGAAPALVFAELSDGRVFSEVWIYVVVLGVVGAVASVTILLSRSANAPARPRAGVLRAVAGAVVLLLPLLVVLAPPSSIAWIYRAVDRGLPAIAYFVLAIAAAAVIGTMRLRPSGRDAMRISVVAWLVYAVLAVTVYRIHASADRRYQDAVVAGRFDELSARLGDDWLSRYLDSSPRATTSPAP